MIAVDNIYLSWCIYSWEIREVFRLWGHLGSKGCTIIWTKRITEHLKVDSVVTSGNTLHQVRGRVIAKVWADVSDAQTTLAGRQIFGMVIRTLVDNVDLYTQQQIF